MNVALWILAGFGACFVLLTAVFLWCMVIDAVLEWRKKPHGKSFDLGRADERNRLLSDSWWFGEDPATQQLLTDLAKGVDVDAARERWRKNRLAAIKPEAIERLRNVAAWAVHHQTNGGAHDRDTILAGNADRRIIEAYEGRV